MRALRETLLEFRGADGFPPVWQANTVMAAPDFERLAREGFEGDELPLVRLPGRPSRWQRPGLWDEVRASIAAGVWWPELHGLHHLPEQAWLGALRRGDADARLALAQQCPVCEAVEASGEYDASEPAAARERSLEQAFALFTRLFGRPPGSLCPPDYRWDAALEAQAAAARRDRPAGRAERAGRWPRARRLLHRWRWPERRGGLLLMPPRIAFEPRGDAAPGSRLGAGRDARGGARRVGPRPARGREHAPPQLRAPRPGLVRGGPRGAARPAARAVRGRRRVPDRRAGARPARWARPRPG